MAVLIVGLILFFGVHSLPMTPARRTALIARFGENIYKAGFGLLSFAGFALIVYGYGLARADGPPVLYDPPFWVRHITMLLMVPVFIFLVAAYVPSHIRRILKHPMLVAVKLWALAHLIANGDLASVLLFGGFLAYAVVDRISVKRRGPGAGQLPGAEKQPGRYGDTVAILVGLGLYALFIWTLHAWLIGVPVI